MKSRTPLLARLWRKLFPAAPPAPPVRLSAAEQPLRKRDPLRDRGIEPLEGRIAPAVLLPNGVDVQYKDLDGDLVTIHFSKSIFAAAPGTGASVDAILGSVFKFSTGSAHTGAPVDAEDGLQQLQLLDLTKVRPNASSTPATGVSFTVTAQKIDSNNDGTLEGDGLVNIGAINATGIALGSISIQGDLGQIDAGLSSSAIAVKSLTVKTLGALTNTQAGTANYESLIVGGIGSFTADSLIGGYLHVTTSTLSGAGTAAKGNIGTVTIAHQIASRDSATGSATNDGRLDVAGNIGTLLIGSGVRDAAHPELSDGLVGGAGAVSGTVKVGGSVTKLIVKGDLRGSTGTGSAGIVIDGQIPTLQVDGSLIGSSTSTASITAGKLGTVTIGTAGGHGLVGGIGDGSAVVRSNSTIGSITVEDIQGAGQNSGGITAKGAISSVLVKGYVKGGSSINSGFIHSDAGLGSVRLVGNLEGGAGAQSGVVSTPGGITLFSGASILGGGDAAVGTGLNSGGVAGGAIGTVTLTESLIGGNGEHSGYITSDFFINSITVKGSIEGRSGLKSGTIVAGSSIGPINISGHVKGGNITVTPAVMGTDDNGNPKVITPEYVNAAALSGSITAGASGAGGITSLNIGDGLLGAEGVSSGVVSAADIIGTVKISRFDALGNRLDAIAGGAGASSGVLYSFFQITTATVNGNIQGGAGLNSGSIQSFIAKTVTVNGNVIGGSGSNSGAIRSYDYDFPNGEFVAGKLGTVNVTGILAGGDGGRSGAISSDSGIASVTVSNFQGGNSVTGGRIVAGAGLHGGGIGVLSIKQYGDSTHRGGTVDVYGSVGKMTTGAITQALIYVQDAIGALNVTGSVADTLMAAGGENPYLGKANIGIGTMTITGAVTDSEIRVGRGLLDDVQNEHAQLGTAKITGHWSSSALLAGAIGTLTTGNVEDVKIAAQDSITALNIHGQLVDSIITARGQAAFNGKTDLAIGSITVTGHVSTTTFKAGYGIDGEALNGHAQIGAVKVTGNWTNSNLVAGVQDAGATGFGDTGDTIIPVAATTVKARIASVVIGGTVDSTGAGQYGFVAQEIGSFKSSQGTLALNATAGQFFSYAGTTGGATTTIREVLPPPPVP